MKKVILTLATIISFIVFSNNVYATEYYDAVNVKTSFSESIDLESIEEIEIYLEDITEYSKDYTLESELNYELTIEDVPVGPVKFVYGVVIGDKIGYYSVSATVNTNNDNTVDVLIIIEESNIKTNTNSSLTTEEIERIKGTSSTNTQSSTIVNNEDDDTGEIIIGDDEEDNSSQKQEETTTVPAAVLEEREKEEEEARKKKERKRNSLIGKIMFSLIGIVLICLIIYAAIKISNANK